MTEIGSNSSDRAPRDVEGGVLTAKQCYISLLQPATSVAVGEALFPLAEIGRLPHASSQRRLRLSRRFDGEKSRDRLQNSVIVDHG